MKCTHCKDCPDRSTDPNCHNPETCIHWAKYINAKEREYQARRECRMVDNTRYHNYMELKWKFINRRGVNYK